MYLVFNSTDNDAQLIIAGGFEEGLTDLSINGPEGTVAINSMFDDGRQIGQADFQFDTTEPLLRRLKRAYPPGQYQFSATTTDGCTLTSTIRLSYRRIEAPVIIFPLEGAVGISAEGFTARWQKIPDADLVHLAIEVEASGKALTVDLPGNATSFRIPASYLKPNILYTMDVIGVADNGNQTVSDVQFTTGP